MIERQLAIDLSYNIPGWCFPLEAGQLYDLLQGSINHVEIGCFCGKSLFIAGCAVPDEASIIGYDPLYPMLVPTTEWQMSVLDATIQAVRKLRPEVSIRHSKLGSVEAARIHRKNFGPNISSLYVDGGHVKEDVLSDLGAWFHLVRPGGLVIVHDYWDYYPGVIEAVEDFFGSRKLKLEFMPRGRLAWHRRPD